MVGYFTTVVRAFTFTANAQTMEKTIMKKIVSVLTFSLLLGFQTQANAMKLSGEEKTVSPTYKPTISAVKKTMEKMGIKYTVDSDGDLEYKMEDTGWTTYVVFDKTSSGKLWNVQMRAQFGTKKSRYDELVEYANDWNATKKYPKVAMIDRDSLSLVLNYPIQYGFNPDEFEDNIFSMFERTAKTIGDETDAMRM